MPRYKVAPSKEAVEKARAEIRAGITVAAKKSVQRTQPTRPSFVVDKGVLEWGAPPPIQHPKRISRMGRLIEALKKRPGEWGLVKEYEGKKAEDRASSYAGAIRRRGLEATARDGAVWAMFPREK